MPSLFVLSNWQQDTALVNHMHIYYDVMMYSSINDIPHAPIQILAKFGNFLKKRIKI